MDTLAVAGVELVTFRLRDFSHPAHHNTAAVLWGFKLNCKQAAFFPHEQSVQSHFHDSIIIPRLFLFVHVFDYTEINPPPGHGAQPTA